MRALYSLSALCASISCVVAQVVPAMDINGFYSYIGSFNDAPPNVEPFPFDGISTPPSTGDVDSCADWCIGFWSGNIMGVKQGGEICACGFVSSLDELTAGRVPSAAGTETCIDKSEEICGGENIMQVYYCSDC
ncbi:hypothetical protein K439DRAFT_1641228 [Ramaria rubella]|nr:hypothetical protein K439DRAFT_1641228 [Ramaria rubella]